MKYKWKVIIQFITQVLGENITGVLWVKSIEEEHASSLSRHKNDVTLNMKSC